MNEAFVSGIFPRSDDLIKAINLFERNRITKEDLEEKIKDEKNFWLEKQNGLTYISDPAVTWNDIFRPFVMNAKNMEIGPLTRYLETNTFFKKPIIRNYPEFFDVIKNEYPDKPILENVDKILLPGPYTFLSVAEIENNLDRKKILDTISDFIFSLARKYRYAEFKEFIVKDINTLKSLGDLYSTYSGKGYVFTNIKTKDFIDFPIDYTVKSENFKNLPDNVIIEFIDVFKTKLEDFSKIPDNIKITTNESLEFLPYSIAIKTTDLMINYPGGKHVL